jgi:uncharacterized glyoxalase superfamily protein PhnB
MVRRLPTQNCPVLKEDKGKICYASVRIGGLTVMFMDMPSDMLRFGEQY